MLIDLTDALIPPMLGLAQNADADLLRLFPEGPPYADMDLRGDHWIGPSPLSSRSVEFLRRLEPDGHNRFPLSACGQEDGVLLIRIPFPSEFTGTVRGAAFMAGVPLPGAGKRSGLRYSMPSPRELSEEIPGVFLPARLSDPDADRAWLFLRGDDDSAHEDVEALIEASAFGPAAAEALARASWMAAIRIGGCCSLRTISDDGSANCVVLKT